MLFVVDDSPSMAAHADALAENLREIAEVYGWTSLDYRIAITSTHVPGPECAPDRGDGALVSSSCLERLGDFVVDANDESDALDLRGVCEAHCDMPRLGAAWLERAPGTPDALACLGQLGVSGCTTESSIAAALRALDRAQDPDDPAYGFLRRDAGLSIVFIGDEDDDSHAVDPDDFLARLDAIERDKQLLAGVDAQRVFVSAVVGDPAPRIRELVSRYDPFVADIVPIEADSWIPALACLPGEDSLPPLCFDRGPLGYEGSSASTAACIVTETQDGETRRLPPCLPDEELPEDADACVVIDDWGSAYCIEYDEGEVRILRRDPRPTPRCIEMTCATEY